MNGLKFFAFALILLGALALVYGGFSYTKTTQAAKIGPIELNVQDRETISIPMWAGIGAIVIGGGLLVWGGRR